MNLLLIILEGFNFKEILLIGIIILVLFGSKKIPEFMKGLGRGVKEFKDGMKGEDQKDTKTETTTKPEDTPKAG